MNRIVPALLAALSVSCLGFPALTAAETTPVGTARTLAQIPFERAWDLQLPSAMHTSWWSSKVPDLLFVQVTDANSVLAIDTMSGLTRWVSMPLPKGIELPAAVARNVVRGEAGEIITQDTLHLLSDERLYHIECGSGHIVWSWLLPYSPSSGLAVAGTGDALRVFSGDWQGRVRAVNFDEPRGLGFVQWQWNTMAAITAQPVVYQDLAYVADHGGVVSAFTMDRERVWTHSTGATIHGSVLTLDRFLYVGNDDHQLIALNRLSGEKRGQLILGGAIRRAPFAYNQEPDRVYVWTTHSDPARSGLHAVKVQPDSIPYKVGNQDGTSLLVDPKRSPLEVVRMDNLWFAQGYDSLVSSTPQHLYLRKGNDPSIYAIERRTGALAWSWNPSAEAGASANLRLTTYQDPTDQVRSIFVTTPSGYLVSYRLQGYKPPELRRALQDRVGELTRAKAKAEHEEKKKSQEAAAETGK